MNEMNTNDLTLALASSSSGTAITRRVSVEGWGENSDSSRFIRKNERRKMDTASLAIFSMNLTIKENRAVEW